MSDMLTPRVWLPFAIVLAIAGCRDSAAPLNQGNVAGPRFSTAPLSTAPRMLQQSPTAPALERYQVSFWARHDKQATVGVDYKSGQPFVRFYVPKFALLWAPDGSRLRGSDSLLITMTLDTVNLQVTFQPSGVVFSSVFAPQLVLYYENANPDLNGDGVVDSADRALMQQLAIWGQTKKLRGWFPLASQNDQSHQYVTATLYHFSQYAVCW